MSYIPHTQDDIQTMLSSIGIKSVDALFDEIPPDLIVDEIQIDSGLTEMECVQKVSKRMQKDIYQLGFIGAGAYEHHIPAAVWDITARGEWMTAYTPYQAEASQGTLQLLYEFQTMMSSLMGLDVANASMYDGATSMCESILMAKRLCKNAKKDSVIIPNTLNPKYIEVLHTVLSTRDIKAHFIDFGENGTIDAQALSQHKSLFDNAFALVIPFPNFFGAIEQVDLLTDMAHEANALVIAVVNPMASCLLKPPGQWGKKGADIACGEGQPLGIPLSSGGPYFGFLTCKLDTVRQMPGRLVGRTTDLEGKTGFALTLQAREQHIRRSKATSNICTNQGLLVTAATIYMSLLGPRGLREVAQCSHILAKTLKEKLKAVSGVKVLFDASLSFHEFVIQTQKPMSAIVDYFTKQGIEPGYMLENDFSNLNNTLLICVTETKTLEDIERFVAVFEDALQAV